MADTGHLIHHNNLVCVCVPAPPPPPRGYLKEFTFYKFLEMIDTSAQRVNFWPPCTLSLPDDTTQQAASPSAFSLFLHCLPPCYLPFKLSRKTLQVLTTCRKKPLHCPLKGNISLLHKKRFHSHHQWQLIKPQHAVIVLSMWLLAFSMASTCSHCPEYVATNFLEGINTQSLC